MVIDNKLDKIFGPVGTIAGITLVAAGIITIRSGYGIIFILIGLLTAFSQTGTQIDTKTRMFRYYNLILGIMKVGRWYSLNIINHITIARSQKVFTAYSRGNRPLDLSEKDIRVLMVGKNPKLKIAVMKGQSVEAAKKQAEELSTTLSIPVQID